MMKIIKDIYNQGYVCISIIQRKDYFHIISNKFLKNGVRTPSTPVFNVQTSESDYSIDKYIMKSLEESGGNVLLNGEKEVKKFLSIKTEKSLFNGSYYFVVCYTFDTKIIKIAKWEKKGGGFIYSDVEKKMVLSDDPSAITKLLREIIKETSPIRY